ncbi:hypothetical protein ACFX1Q_008522 [Malus domestica]
MQSAQSTQQKESELKNSRSCHICLKKQAEKNAACSVNSAERALWAARADSPPLNQILKDQVTNWNKSSSILKIIPLTKLLRCELERLNRATSRHFHLVPACHVFESTFKNQASTALEEAFSQIRNQASTALEEITRIQKILQPSSRSKLWKVNKRNKIRADSSTTKAKNHLPHEAPCGPISTFKIKPRRSLKKFQTKVQEQASTALEEISSPIQDQASTTLEEISSPIQDQASTALGSTSTIKDFKTHLLHVTSTSLKHPGSRRIKKAFFVLHSSFFQDQAPTAIWINNHPPIQDQAPTALEESTIVHHPFIQDQAPTTLEESTIVHHPFIQDQAQRPFGSTTSANPHTSNRSSRSSPKALEDLFITVSSRSSPKALEDPLITVIQDQASNGP